MLIDFLAGGLKFHDVALKSLERPKIPTPARPEIPTQAVRPLRPSSSHMSQPRCS